MCGSFLTIQRDQVSLVHHSAKDYLTKIASVEIFPNGPGPIHFDMFSRSLADMDLILQRDIYGLKHPGLSVSDMKQPDLDRLAPIRYSCVFWVYHLRDANGQSSDYKNRLSNDGSIFTFLKTHFLYWLESLSLLNKVSDGILSIRELLRMVQVCI
jgi:hypothetical protein